MCVMLLVKVLLVVRLPVPHLLLLVTLVIHLLVGVLMRLALLLDIQATLLVQLLFLALQWVTPTLLLGKRDQVPQ